MNQLLLSHFMITLNRKEKQMDAFNLVPFNNPFYTIFTIGKENTFYCQCRNLLITQNALIMHLDKNIFAFLFFKIKGQFNKNGLVNIASLGGRGRSLPAALHPESMSPL